MLRQDLLSSVSCGAAECINNDQLSFFAVFSSTIATPEAACAILPTLASVAGKLMASIELLKCLLSVSHWIIVKLFLWCMRCVCECHQSNF